MAKSDYSKHSEQDAIEEESKEYTPLKQPQIQVQEETKSDNLDWNYDVPNNEPVYKNLEEGFVNKCIEDIKHYYEKPEEKLDQLDIDEKSSQSSSFHMEPDKSNRSPNPIHAEKAFDDIQPIGWPEPDMQTLHPVVQAESSNTESDVTIEEPPNSIDHSSCAKPKREIFLTDQLNEQLRLSEASCINSDLKDLEINNESPSKNADHQLAAPIVNHDSLEKSFEGSKARSSKLNQNDNNLGMPEKPNMDNYVTPTNAKPKAVNLDLDPPTSEPAASTYEDPQLTPESNRPEELDLREENSRMIADQLIHTMLSELDDDKGINKALNGGELPEEMPSFLTRGIKTNTFTISEYLQELFDKIKGEKEQFLESLSTPLHRDPLEILSHLQDTEVDSDKNSEAMPFQQSVLHVELYLDNEKQRRLNKMSEFDRQAELDKAEEKKAKRQQKMLEAGVLYDEMEDSDDDESIMAEWENIHNKVIFD